MKPDPTVKHGQALAGANRARAYTELVARFWESRQYVKLSRCPENVIAVRVQIPEVKLAFAKRSVCDRIAELLVNHDMPTYGE